MSVTFPAFPQAVLTPINTRYAKQPAHQAAKPQPLFAGEAEDKFVRSKKKDPLNESQAKQMLNHTYGRDLLTHYAGRLDVLQQHVLNQADFLKSEPIHPSNNPETLTYFDLLKLLQEKADEHPQRFLKDVSVALSDLQRKASRNLFAFNRNIPTSQLTQVQKVWDPKNQTGCTVDHLTDSMGETEQAYLPFNLKRLEEAKLINRDKSLITGHLRKYDNDNTYYNQHETGITLTRLGKAVLDADGDGDNTEDLVNILLPNDPWTYALSSKQEENALRERLLLLAKDADHPASSQAPASPVNPQSSQPSASAAQTEPAADAKDQSLIEL